MTDRERDPGAGTGGEPHGAIDTGAAREVSVYEYVGGTPFFVRLVERFYEDVATDPLLSPMYPDDLAGPRARLAAFLVQYWGGPTHYSDARGHPRLRMRHAPYRVDSAAREAWLAHMHAAVEASGVDARVQDLLLDYFTHAATAMVNTAPDRM
jgi:hemoglobin